jgi:hypothetical protein
MHLHLLDAIQPQQLRHDVAEAQLYLPLERLEKLQVPAQDVTKTH